MMGEMSRCIVPMISENHTDNWSQKRVGSEKHVAGLHDTYARPSKWVGDEWSNDHSPQRL